MTSAGFWMVVVAGTPTFKHDTLMSATIEAERLAILNPGQTFTVLKSVRSVTKTSVQWVDHVYVDECGNEVPF